MFKGINYVSDVNGSTEILASNVMSYHSVLTNSQEFVGAMKYARHIADNLTKTLDIPGVEIYPYR